MKTKIGLAALAVALLSSGAAYGADVFGRGESLKDGNVFTPKAVNWTGFYIGGSLGYGNANHNLSVHDYFKDFCQDATVAANPDYDPFENDTSHTLDNHNREHLGEGDANDVTHPRYRPSCDQRVGWAGEGEGAPNVGTDTGDVTVSGQSREIASVDGINSSGLVGDGRVGFDLQRGRFVGGIFASYGFNDMSTDVSFGGTTIKAIEKGDEWSIGARAGLLVNERTLAYILAAYTETEYSFAGIGSNGGNKDVTFSGVTVGGGVEFALTQNVFLGVEGTHTFYGEETIADFYSATANRGLRLEDEIGETKVMGTLKIKLNSGLPNLTD
jgi:outer membrane immunogenic protein